jgi:transposase
MFRRRPVFRNRPLVRHDRTSSSRLLHEQHFCVKVHKRTIAKWLRQLELTRLQPRPFHPKKDGAAQEAFKKTSAA